MMIVKQRLNLLKPYVYLSKHATPKATRNSVLKSDYGIFEKLPSKIAEELLTGHPNIDPEDIQNKSPTAKELIDFAKKYDGTLGGYFISVMDDNRDDHRITLESVYLNMSKTEAEELKEKIFPDEFSQQKDGTWRFWWD